MSQDTFLYTTPQWFIFASIIALVYGWVEKKRIFTFIGLALFILLGIYSLYAIIQGYFVFSKYLTPEEIIGYELEEDVVEEIPLAGKLLPAYWLFILTGILGIPGILLEWKKKKQVRILIIIAGLIALSGFFIIVSALKE
ncbi:MAG: hypothetical protein JXR31_06585 [Prolixibacteraceae bacterium]|nr:hypothetical protein [Prolixibacteraceae bacterium]MBN2773897.1 hypothetical protein [Prolixibacteraceae bacterium]